MSIRCATGVPDLGTSGTWTRCFSRSTRNASRFHPAAWGGMDKFERAGPCAGTVNRRKVIHGERHAEGSEQTPSTWGNVGSLARSDAGFTLALGPRVVVLHGGSGRGADKEPCSSQRPCTGKERATRIRPVIRTAAATGRGACATKEMAPGCPHHWHTGSCFSRDRGCRTALVLTRDAGPTPARCPDRHACVHPGLAYLSS